MKADILGIHGWGAFLGGIGWLFGLAYSNWFAHNPPHVGFWRQAFLVAGGEVLLNAIVATFIGMLCSGISKLQTGHYQAVLWPFLLGAVAQPIVLFYGACYAILQIAN